MLGFGVVGVVEGLHRCIDDALVFVLQQIEDRLDVDVRGLWYIAEEAEGVGEFALPFGSCEPFDQDLGAAPAGGVAADLGDDEADRAMDAS